MALTSAQIASILQISSDASLISGAAEITDVSNYSSIGIASGDTVKVLLWIQDPTLDTVYKNAGYDAADFTNPDLLPLTTPDSYSFTLPTYTTGDYVQGQYNVNMKVQVTQGSDITEASKQLHMNVCGCCNNIVAVVNGDVSYNTAIVSAIDNTDYGTWTALTNVLTLYPPTNTGSAQVGTFHGAPATLTYEPPVGTFPYTGVWQWTLSSTISYTDSLSQTTTTCLLTAQGSFSVIQSQLCKVRCLLDKYRTELYAKIRVKSDPARERAYLLAEADYLMAFASERCALPQTTIDKYITNIYALTGIDPDCNCGCSDGTSQPLVPTSIVNGTDGADGSQILYGSGVPAGGTGAVGDSYIDTATGDMYLKTGASTWAFKLNIKGTDGDSGYAVLYNQYPAASTAGTAWETLATYQLPAAQLATNQDEITIRTVFTTNAASPSASQLVRQTFNGSALNTPLNIGFYASNITKIIIQTRLTRVSNTSAKYEQDVLFCVTGLGGTNITNWYKQDLTTIGTLNFTTTAYDITADGNSVVAGDITLESMEILYYKKA